ncbi:hypothetical protein [Pradoshia sp.]|uniref:hypothetical protein n=1 Tax=Pradoshia sp. TaxID=2651281 RepID=UPI003EFD59E9
MNVLMDAVYNWLTIRIVYDVRPDDTAARDTVQMFEKNLEEDHGIDRYAYEKKDGWYTVVFTKDGKEDQFRYREEMVEVMLKQILKHPERYEQFPSE